MNIPVNQYYEHTKKLIRDGYKHQTIKARYKLGDFNDVIYYNHAANSYIVFIYSDIYEKTRGGGMPLFYKGFKVREYTRAKLPQKYTLYIY